MRKSYILNAIIAFLIIVFLVVLDYSYFDVFLSNVSTTSSKVIIIDAGHGGIDPGGNVNEVMEKDINLSISKKLKAYLEEQGYTCIMVREVDEGLYSQDGTIRNKKNEDLRNRRAIIRDNKANMFISIHLNKFPQTQYYGAQVFYPKGDEESRMLAKSTQNELIRVLGRGNTRVEKPSDSYYILKGNNIPSMIVECGFLSNQEEKQLLKDENYQNKVAWAIYCGVIKYYKAPGYIGRGAE